MKDPKDTDSLDGAAPLLPRMEEARALVGCRWTRIEIQGGRLTYESRLFPGAWSTASIRVHACDDVLVHSESYEYGGVEYFGLRVRPIVEAWSATHLKLTRPSFRPILSWPVGIDLPQRFFETGPDSAEAGFGDAPVGNSAEASLPLLWLVLRAGNSGFFVFADREIPLNVGIGNLDAMEPIVRAMRAASVVRL